MRLYRSVIFIVYLFGCLLIQNDSCAGDLKPYPLPPAARARMENVAENSDLLILGEIHGTREVPELVTGLLTPLTKLGYNTLALEIPNEDQASVRAWACGKTNIIPEYFAKPNGDGRGNVELLALIRIAASPPFLWRIICFDISESIAEQDRLALIREKEKQTGRADIAQLTNDDMVSMWKASDATMASNLLREARLLRATKVLAISGNVHARTTNDIQERALAELWPSFAEMVKRGQPAWSVNSVNIEFCGGAFFNGGVVRTIKGRPLECPEIRSADQSGWSFLLRLPTANPATFLPPNKVSATPLPRKVLPVGN